MGFHGSEHEEGADTMQRADICFIKNPGMLHPLASVSETQVHFLLFSICSINSSASPGTCTMY